jgi:hypothetical protein
MNNEDSCACRHRLAGNSCYRIGREGQEDRRRHLLLRQHLDQPAQAGRAGGRVPDGCTGSKCDFTIRLEIVQNIASFDVPQNPQRGIDPETPFWTDGKDACVAWVEFGMDPITGHGRSQSLLDFPIDAWIFAGVNDNGGAFATIPK